MVRIIHFRIHKLIFPTVSAIIEEMHKLRYQKLSEIGFLCGIFASAFISWNFIIDYSSRLLNLEEIEIRNAE